MTQRIFVCPEWHLVLPRDWNAARCIEQLGLHSLEPNNYQKFVPTGHWEVTPSEMESSTQKLVIFAPSNSIRLCASSVVEQDTSD